jgi:hypothetical protein
MVLLLDFYGELLTKLQKETITMYYEEDLSLGEIARIQDISRQAVRETVKRSEHLLTEIEEKLHFAQRYLKIKENYNEINEQAKKINDTNIRDKITELTAIGCNLL